MPEISRFFGIIIAMFYDDHNPQSELMADWQLAKENKQPAPIEPLQ